MKMNSICQIPIPIKQRPNRLLRLTAAREIEEGHKLNFADSANLTDRYFFHSHRTGMDRRHRRSSPDPSKGSARYRRDVHGAVISEYDLAVVVVDLSSFFYFFFYFFLLIACLLLVFHSSQQSIASD